MRLVRGRAATRTADRGVTRTVIESAGETREPAVRVWRPHRQVVFGPRDRREPGYEAARAIAADHGFPPTDRSSGGRAVAYTGQTLAFVRADPVTTDRTGIDQRYDRVLAAIERALAAVGVEADRGEPAGAFCPGTHSLSADGKLVGVAQRVERDVAATVGVVVVDEAAAIADVLDPVYDALDIPFEPTTVGSVADAGGDQATVPAAIEDALVGDRSVTVQKAASLA